ncbi:helix-turn-helix domain-containing protein [Streptomyces sp. NBC_00963]|uniref:PucR family transcriptional regulator n=1 Tax=Streptomyces sp. NBC_00963 TaxID=2903697 RepID=UPI00386C9980|nr:helix-turn-helix domain-containing protein [Streptomyces sp. NBC_00963]
MSPGTPKSRSTHCCWNSGICCAARAALPDGPIERLRTYDRENGTALVETPTAWLDSLGNVLGASASLDVHPNTFRYRLARAAEIAGTDLDDPGKRFAAMLELRVMRADSP